MSEKYSTRYVRHPSLRNTEGAEPAEGALPVRHFR